MSKIITTLSDGIGYLNTLYNVSSTPPTSGEEDYIVWTSLFNIAKNLWETEELWKELAVKLSDAPDGDKTTNGTNSYTLPTLFCFPMCGFIWIGSGTNKTAYKVIKIQEKQLHENDSSNWCYFTNTALEFNPNLTMSTGDTITYEYYKFATKMTTGTDLFEMSDPLFAIYYALSELKKDEGDVSAGSIASQKLQKMKDINSSPAWFQSDNLLNQTEDGMGE